MVNNDTYLKLFHSVVHCTHYCTYRNDWDNAVGTAIIVVMTIWTTWP